MYRRLLAALTALTAISAATIALTGHATAADFGHTVFSKHHHDDDSEDDGQGDEQRRHSDDTDSSDSGGRADLEGLDGSSPADNPEMATGRPSGGKGTILSGAERTITARLTGYSWQDNTPPGSATISRPILHSKAGGNGTFADPTTAAVPGSGGKNMETPAGTRFYVPKLRRYFLVEDSGASKADEPHYDLWVGGEGFSKSASDKCMNSYTGSAQIIVNPKAGLPVTAGPLTGPSGCVI